MAAPPRPFEKKLASAQLFAKIQLMSSKKNPNPKEEERRKKEEAKKVPTEIIYYSSYFNGYQLLYIYYV